MSKLSITIEITSTTQLQALENALEMFSESEGERLKDEEKLITSGAKRAVRSDAAAVKRDRAVQVASAELLKAIRGGK